MSIDKTPLFGMLGEKMNWLTQRQRVLGQNVANADTPGYVARDLKALDFRAALQKQQRSMHLTKTNDTHIKASSETDNFRTGTQRKTYETSLSENNVILEEQLMKLNTTSTDYEMVTGLFKKYTNLYKIALGRNG